MRIKLIAQKIIKEFYILKAKINTSMKPQEEETALKW